MKTSLPHTILGISPGTRYTGVAVLVGSELIDWGIRVNEGKWSEQKLAKALAVVSELIEHHQPDVLAIKRVHPARSSEGLDQLHEAIVRLARERRLTVREWSLQDLERLSGGAANRHELARRMCWKYPVLRQELRREQSHQAGYHLRMFEAAALASCHSELHRRP